MKSLTRFSALDVFRGMTVCFMIIVNNPGSALSFSPLEHSAWNGFTPTDLVYPSFLFAMGNALSFSMQKLRELDRSAAILKILKRSLLIFLIGYLIYWFPFFKIQDGQFSLLPISHTRILGVLQRIGLCYAIAALLVYFFSNRVVMITAFLTLFAYWFFLLVFGDAQAPFSLHGNAGLPVDRFLLGESHLYQGEGFPFELESIPGTFPSVVNVLIGYFAGEYVRKKGGGYEQMTKLLLVGSLFIFLALFWDLAFPINKKLWTSSFVLLTGGIDLIILSALIFVIDQVKWKAGNWTYFFEVFGKNTLFIYVFAEVFGKVLSLIHIGENHSLKHWLSDGLFQTIAPGKIGSLLYALSYMLICWLLGLALDYKKVYIRV